LSLDAGVSTRKKYENVFIGDIIEISGSNSNGVTYRAIYVVTSKPEPQSRRTKFRVEFIEGAGDTEGIPWQDDEDQNNPNRKDTRVEIFPSVPTDSFARKEDYQLLTKASYPIGIVCAWFTEEPPEGWLICDGSSIGDDPKYAELKQYFPSTLPDCRGRALIGTGRYGLTTVNTFVDQTTAKPNNTPRSTTAGGHKHSVTIASNGTHYHNYGDSSKSGGGTTKTAYGGQNGGSYKTSSAGSHTHAVTIVENGEHHHEITGWDTYNRMYSRTCHWIIKAYHITE